MKKINLSNTTINLDIWDELKVKDLRKIQPLITQYEWQEVEMVIEVIKALSPDSNIEATLNDLNVDDFTKLSEEISALIEPDTKKKWGDNKAVQQGDS